MTFKRGDRVQNATRVGVVIADPVDETHVPVAWDSTIASAIESWPAAILAPFVPPPPPPGPSIAIALDVPPDWPERLSPALSLLAPKLVRMNIARMTDAAKTAKTFALIRRADASVIAMAPYPWNEAKTVDFARRYLQRDDLIEAGNETGYISTNLVSGVAKSYAPAVRSLVIALRGGGVPVGVLAQGDPAIKGSLWNDGLYAAVPDLHLFAAGFTVHPYGPAEATRKPDGRPNMDGYRNRLRGMHTQLTGHGAPSTVPIYITEYGVATDNGATLYHDGVPDNYGWPRDLTYAQAARALTEAVADIDSLPYNIKALSLFQWGDQRNPGASRDREHYFGALHLDGSPKPGLTEAVRALMA